MGDIHGRRGDAGCTSRRLPSYIRRVHQVHIENNTPARLQAKLTIPTRRSLRQIMAMVVSVSRSVSVAAVAALVAHGVITD